MFSMENLDLEAVNGQFLLEAGLYGGAIDEDDMEDDDDYLDDSSACSLSSFGGSGAESGGRREWGSPGGGSSSGGLSHGSRSPPKSRRVRSRCGGKRSGGHHHHHHHHHQMQQQRQAANLRERRRMQSINDAFEGLRAHVPTLPYERRLSKVDTLRLAIGYIGFLTELVRAADRSGDQGGSPEGAVGSTTMGGVSGGLRRNGANRHEPTKVIVRAGLVGGCLGVDGSRLGAFAVHSLSWSSNKENSRHGTMFAKVWTPEDPRANKNCMPSESTTSFSPASSSASPSSSSLDG